MRQLQLKHRQKQQQNNLLNALAGFNLAILSVLRLEFTGE